MDEQDSITASELKRAWRIITWAGFLGSSYYLLCVAGAPRIKYLTELGATPLDFGIISSLGTAALAFQIVGSILGNRIRRRKPLWMALVIVHRLVFVGVLLAPVLPVGARAQIAWILLILFCHDALAQTSVPIWFSWMADLVPMASLTRHWATRQRFITAATILVMILIAAGFYFFERADRIVLGFTVLACVGVIVGIIDILMFHAVPEPPYERVENSRWFETLIQPVRDRAFRPFLLFMGYWQFAVFAAAPFFGLYMLEYLHLSVVTVQLLGTAGALGVAVSSRFWGLLGDSYGYRPLLQFLVICKAFTPLAFMLAPHNSNMAIPFLAVVSFFDGVLNSGVMLSLQGPLLKSTPRRNRTTYIAATNFFAVGVMASLAPVISGHLIGRFESGLRVGALPILFSGYHIVFMLSLVLRLSALVLASRIVEPAAASLPTVFRDLCSRGLFRAYRLVYRMHESHDESERLHSVQLLGDLKNPVAIGELVQALQDPSCAVRDAAADALGQIGASKAAEPLSRALLDPASGIQGSAARALGRIGSADSLKALLQNLANRDSAALAETIDSLAQIGHDAAILPLICLFNDIEDPTLRTRVAAALATLSEIDSIEEVFGLLHARRPLSQQILK